MSYHGFDHSVDQCDRTCFNEDAGIEQSFWCSNCGYQAETFGDKAPRPYLCDPSEWDYCPMCGARVIEER